MRSTSYPASGLRLLPSSQPFHPPPAAPPFPQKEYTRATARAARQAGGECYPDRVRFCHRDRFANGGLHDVHRQPVDAAGSRAGQLTLVPGRQFLTERVVHGAEPVAAKPNSSNRPISTHSSCTTATATLNAVPRGRRRQTPRPGWRGPTLAPPRQVQNGKAGRQRGRGPPRHSVAVLNRGTSTVR